MLIFDLSTFYVHTLRYNKIECSQKWKNVIKKLFLVGTGDAKEKKLVRIFVLHTANLKIILLQEDILQKSG